MLGVVLASVENFPFSVDEIKTAITQMNAKVAPQNLKILDMSMTELKD